VRDFFTESLGTVLRDIRSASLHSQSEQSSFDQDPSVIKFLFFLLGFYLRGLLSIPMESAPPILALYFTVYSGLYIILYYNYYFVYSVFRLFYSFSLPYTRLVMRTWRN
jgi:hypothetical protein